MIRGALLGVGLYSLAAPGLIAGHDPTWAYILFGVIAGLVGGVIGNGLQ